MTGRGLAAGVLCAVVAASCAREPVSLSVAVSTEEPGPSVARAMQPLLAEQGIALDTQTSDGPNDSLDAVLGGEIELAIVEEPARRIPGLTTVVPLYPSILHVYYRKGRDVSTFPELIRGQHVYAGPIGGTAARLLGLLAGDYMVSQADYTILPDPWRVEPDVFFILGGLLEPASLGQFSDYEMFSFGAAERLGSGTQAEGLALKHPNIRPFILPDAVYGTLSPRPILTLQTRTVLVAREDIDPDLAYRITRELIERAHEVAVEYHLVPTELNDQFEPNLLALPLHRGSRVYIDKDEPSFLERYADVIGVALTVAAAIGSGLLAVIRMNRARRKDRIDVFYRRILAIRHELDNSDSINEYNNLEEKIKVIQEEVFKLLIAERLNVDESLTLFLDLSNRVLGEITAKKTAVEGV